ncbi:glycosyltransferase family 4 protein [Sinorhizobium sp. NFACC03]|uniref:glycosyltransferase family 4 protein n=1 Tax=Sinorhizobium sp. NFACC03 TaxID=1566295 RepID=UPI000882A54F|nr:glycosyltransferase family 4 protein [Sinorhizobium sp. NFACC03]SDA92774.1 Glycosyltransferase involved in cell wall bisynthesis [Sinorhizobium sp. NFACC03]
MQGEDSRTETPEASETIVRATIVVPGLGPGGTEHVVNLVSNHWASKGFEVTILTFEEPTSVAYYAFDPRIEIWRIGGAERPRGKLHSALLAWRRMRRLATALRRSRPTFVLSFLTRTNVLTLLAGNRLKVPIIVSERNNPQLQPFGRGWKWLRERLYPRAFGLVTMTRGALEMFPPTMRKRGWVVPNAFDLPEGWHNRRQENILTAVGRLTYQKGFDLLLEAFAKIAPDLPEWQLCIWGEGEDRAKLEAQRERLGLVDRVRMPGVTKRPGEWVETADVFVLSSRYEGWGIVLLEAMAAGIAVVSFKCEWGPEEMVSDGKDGILVEREDIEALATALLKVMRNPLLRYQLGRSAEESARRFSQDRVLADWDEVAVAATRAST